MAIESVSIEEQRLIVIHRRQDGSEVRESFTPALLQRLALPALPAPPHRRNGRIDSLRVI